jgi:hypothetical protein
MKAAKSYAHKVVLGWVMFAMLFIGLPAAVSAATDQEPPAGISLGEWQKMQAQIRKAQYHFTPDNADTYSVSNRNHGFEAKFSRDAAEFKPKTTDASPPWNFRLSIGSYGYGSATKPVLPAEIVANENRLEFRRGELTEWYVNDESGMEQGFTISKPPLPRNGEPLRIEMQADTGLCPQLSRDKQSVDFEDASGQTVLNYHKLAVSDADGKKIPAHFETTENVISIIVEDRDARYPLTVDPIISLVVTEKKLSLYFADVADRFGHSVSVNGDILVVGSCDDDISGSAYIFYNNQGSVNNWELIRKITPPVATSKFGYSVSVSGDIIIVGTWSSVHSAYIFSRNQGGTDNWGLVKTLTATGIDEYDKFGASVSISGDIIVVASPYNRALGGSAYIFLRNQGGTDNWGQVKKITASDSATFDSFGSSVSVSGDIIVVASYSGNSSGSAYIFSKNQGGTDNWGQVKKITASDSATFDSFGSSVSVSGDIIVVGSNSNNSSGSAYIFSRNQGGTDNWGQVKKIRASDAAANDQFGWSVSVSGDSIVVGTYGDDDSGAESGSAYIFYRNQGGTDNWGQVKKITASDAAAYNHFGWSVSVSRDTIVVGAYGDDDGGSYSGSAFIFSKYQGGAGNWGQIKKITASYGSFGLSSVSISGDIIVVGAQSDDDSGAESGSAYIFSRNQGGTDDWGQVRKIRDPDGRAGDHFGRSVSVSGDIIVVGAEGDDDGGIESGSAYIFSKEGTDYWWFVRKITASDATEYHNFGCSVSISGDIIVVGALSPGSAYIFSRNQGGTNNWGQVKKITAPDAITRDNFGFSVSVSGDIIVVGAFQDGLSSGSAYIFSRNQGGTDNWGLVRKITASDAAAGDWFGQSVSVSGDIIVVGADGDDDGGSYSGSAYIFYRNQGGTDNWGQVRKITASDAAASDWFGRSVSVSGDIIVVGAEGDDDSGQESGSAYIFYRNQGGTDNWGQLKKLTSNSRYFGQFGDSVSISGDTLVVGAFSDIDGYVYDLNFAPYVISITPTSPNPTNAVSVTFTITFSETVTGVDINAFVLSQTGTASGTISSVSGTGNVYTVTVSGISGTGMLGLNLIDNDSIFDNKGLVLGGVGSGNGNFTGQYYTVDRDVPTITSVTSGSPARIYKAGEMLNITVNFSEPVTLNGTLNITLNTGTVISIPSFTSSPIAIGAYIVGNTDAVPLLTASSISVSGTLQDSAGNAAVIALPSQNISNSKTIVIDGIPPNPPIISALTPTFNASPKWTISSGGNGSGIFRYKIDNSSLDSGAIEKTSSALFDYTAPSVLSPGFHTLYVQERDAAGNWSPISSLSIQVVRTAPSVFGSSVPLTTTTPTWTWSGLNDFGDIDYFRIRLDNSDLSSGAILTTDTTFTPAYALTQGSHTLFVQQKDSGDSWSQIGSATLQIQSPSKGISATPLSLEISEPQGSGEFSVRLAVKPIADVRIDILPPSAEILIVTPLSILLTPDNWETGVKVTVKDSPYNLVNTRSYDIYFQAAVSNDGYYNGMFADTVSVTIRDDAEFSVLSVNPRYGIEGQYLPLTILGTGFEESKISVYYRQDCAGCVETQATRTISNFRSILSMTVPDPNLNPKPLPPKADERYIIRITDGQQSFEETVYIVPQEDPDALKRKKALIVAGGGDNGDYLWEATRFSADKAYSALVFQGYSDENLMYLSAGSGDAGKKATLSNFQNAVTEWSHTPFAGSAIDELLIYMTGHGSNGAFTLSGSPDSGILYANVLKGWLDTLQHNYPRIRVILIYDACYSGSFVDKIGKSPERIIITSAKAEQVALFGDNGNISFSAPFWNAVMTQGMLNRSFVSAAESMAKMRLTQVPQITDMPVNDLKIGLGLKQAASPIDIGTICPNITLTCDTNKANIWVKDIKPPHEIQSVYARVVYYDSDKTTDMPFNSLIEAPSTDPNNPVYERVFDSFSKPGTYFVCAYAQNMRDKESNRICTLVTKTCSVRGELNNDNKVDLADAILALKVLSGISVSVNITGDVNSDNKIGIEDVIYILQFAAGLRQ